MKDNITTMLLILGIFTFIIIIVVMTITTNSPETIEVSGYVTCNSKFHVRCDGICKSIDVYVLHYGYVDDYCKFKIFTEDERDSMEEQLCFIK